MFVRRFIRSESLRSKVQLEIEQCMETSVYLTEKNGLFVGDNINVNQNIEYWTLYIARAAMDK